MEIQELESKITKIKINQKDSADSNRQKTMRVIEMMRLKKQRRLSKKINITQRRAGHQ